MFLHNMCTGINLRAFRSIFTSSERRNDEIAAKFHKKVIKKIKHIIFKRVNTFPCENSTGSGFFNQSCVPKFG